MLNNVQVLRAAAALAVAVSHVERLNPAVLSLHYGTFGVELFFVISGFIMVHITDQRKLSPGRFMANRIVRIVPLYWLLTIAVFCVAAVAPSLLGSTEANPADLAKSLLFIPYLKKSGAIQPLLFVGWTLNYEMFFYVLFALSLFLEGRLARVLALVAVLAALVGLGIVLQPRSTLGIFYTAPIMLEFAYGMVLSLVFGQLKRFPSLAGAFAMVAGAVLLPVLSQPERLGAYVEFVRGGCAAAIVFGALVLQARGKVLNWKPALLLGGASYSLYLVHPFALIPIDKVARHFGLLEGVMLWPVLVLSIAAMALAGIVLHLTLEKWLQDMLRPALRPAARSG